MNDKNLIIKKYKKQVAIFRVIGLFSLLVIFIYFLITVLQCKTFDKNVIVACSVFADMGIVFCILFTFFDIKRKSIVLKYYGEVGEVDRNRAKDLLKK